MYPYVYGGVGYNGSVVCLRMGACTFRPLIIMYFHLINYLKTRSTDSIHLASSVKMKEKFHKDESAYRGPIELQFLQQCLGRLLSRKTSALGCSDKPYLHMQSAVKLTSQL